MRKPISNVPVMQCYAMLCNVYANAMQCFQGSLGFKFVKQAMNKHLLVLFLFFFFLSTKIVQNNKRKHINLEVLSLPWALPLGAEVGVDVALLVK